MHEEEILEQDVRPFTFEELFKRLDSNAFTSKRRIQENLLGFYKLLEIPLGVVAVLNKWASPPQQGTSIAL